MQRVFPAKKIEIDARVVSFDPLNILVLWQTIRKEKKLSLFWVVFDTDANTVSEEEIIGQIMPVVVEEKTSDLNQSEYFKYYTMRVLDE